MAENLARARAVRAVIEKRDATLEHYMKAGAWFAGPPEELVAYLRSLEAKYPGLEYVHLSNSMGTPKAAMLEQIAWLGKEVMPKFTA